MSSVVPAGSTATARVTRLMRGPSVVVDPVDTFVAGVNAIDLASLMLSASVVEASFGAGVVVASGGYKPFTDNALPSNGLKYCTRMAKRRAVF